MGAQMVKIENEELERVTIHFLRRSAEHMTELAHESSSPAIRSRLQRIREQLEELAARIERGE